jgi:hypothetical protein
MSETALDISKRLIEERQLGSGRMGINDDKTNTNLISKHYSPMIVRKYNIINGWPLYLGIIADSNLDTLDSIVNATIKQCKEAEMITNSIQNMRNLTGILSETIIEYYNQEKENCVEGVAILLYVDKCVIENFYGDFMNHTSCRIEWAGIMGMIPHI